LLPGGAVLIPEKGVLPRSTMRFWMPSASARELYFYALCAGRFICDGDYHLERKDYQSYLAMYVESGEGFLEVFDRRYPVSAGDLILIDCRTPHRYFTTTGWEMYWLHFHGNVSARLYEMIVSHKGNVLTARGRSDIRECMVTIVDRVLQERFLDEAALSALIHTLLSKLLPLPSAGSVSGHLSRAVADGVLLIQAQYAHPLRLDHIANSVGLSPFHFARLFKAQTKFAPHEFLIVTRIDRAKILLKMSPRSVKEIGFDCGFRSEVSFVTTFKRKTGFTPTGFRKKQ
jgi:AraC-like DNA-binding protein/mannose-6-phosphate isomerase-like protein (cupin superfamily)